MYYSPKIKKLWEKIGIKILKLKYENKERRKQELSRLQNKLLNFCGELQNNCFSSIPIAKQMEK
jgi:hypothetical protein